jgi:hypothetical protein
MLTMESYIAKVITIAVKYNVDGIRPSVMASRLDSEILDLLIEFIDRHDSFYSYNHSIELEDLRVGHWGYYSHRCQALVVINRSLVEGLSKRLAVGTGESILYKLVNTMLHEHRHCYQYRHHLPMTKVPYVTADEDSTGYWNHPMEVDAREYAELYTQEALEYVYGKLRTKYAEPIAEKHRESTI